MKPDNQTTENLETFLSGTEAARVQNMPQRKFNSLVESGKIKPDAKCSRGYLFKEEKIKNQNSNG